MEVVDEGSRCGISTYHCVVVSVQYSCSADRYMGSILLESDVCCRFPSLMDKT